MAFQKRGFILRTTDFGDSDLIFNFLDHEGSLKSFRARGAKASKKRFSGGVLEPLQYIELQYEEKGEDHSQLLEAKILSPFEEIRSDYDRIMWGTKVLRLTHFYSQEGLAEPDLFHLVGNSLKKLNRTDSNPEVLFYHFLARLMALQGDLERTDLLGELLLRPVGDVDIQASALKEISKSLSLQFRAIFSKELKDFF